MGAAAAVDAATTQTEAGIKDTSPGSVVPFRQSVNADAPSTTAMYARD